MANFYFYIRAIVFTLIILIIGLSVGYADPPVPPTVSPIEQIIKVLQGNHSKGAKDVIVMVCTDGNDGMRNCRALPVDAVGMSPEAPGVSIILVHEGHTA